ncbi:ATP-binding protein [Acinetobacter sp. YH12126]
MWLNHFEDQTVGEALLDRLVHRAHVFNFKRSIYEEKTW